MKVSIYTHGDPQVNIGGQEANIDMPYFEFLDEEDRQNIRENLGEFFAEFFDDRSAYVVFGDECPDCGGRDEKHANCCPTRPD